MIIDFLHKDDHKVSQAITPYQEDGIYWAFVDNNDRLISLFSFQLDCEVKENDLGIPFKLGYINKQSFEIIKRSLLTKSVVCYLDREAEEIMYYRFVLEVQKMDDTNIKLIVNFLDEHDQSEPVTDLKIYSARLPSKENKINKCNIEKTEENIFNVEFLNKGRYNLKISARHRNMKLKTYVPWSI